MTPNNVEPSARANMGGVARWWERANPTISSTGSAGAYVYTPSNTSYPTGYTNGETICFKPNFTSVGSDTLNVNSLGAKPIYYPTSSGPVAVVAGTITSAEPVCVIYYTALNSSAGGFEILSGIGLPAGLVATNTGSPAQGDLLYYTGSTWTDLGPGTSGQFLKTNGASANPAWANACSVSGGAQYNPIVNNGSNGCANDTSALLNGQTLTLGVSNASAGAILLNASGTTGSAQILAGTTTNELDLFTSTSSGLIKVGGNAGVELGSYTAGPAFANKLDYNVTNAGNWTFGAVTIFPSGDALIGTGTNYVGLIFTGTGTNNATLPQNTGTIAELNLAQTWSQQQGFNNGDLLLNGSSSGSLVLKCAVAACGSNNISFPAVTDTVGMLGTVDQTMAGGVNLTSNNIGTVSSGTTTIDCGKNPSQYLTNNGAFTLAAPSNDGTCILEVINGASAGTITFSGWTEGSNTGDSLDTTNTHKFFLSLMRTNGTSHYVVSAAQ